MLVLRYKNTQGEDGKSNKANVEQDDFIRSLNDAPTLRSLGRRLSLQPERINEALNTPAIREKLNDDQILMLAAAGEDKHKVIALCNAIIDSDAFVSYRPDTQETMRNILQTHKNMLHCPSIK